MSLPDRLTAELPAWVAGAALPGTYLPDDRMRLAIRLSRENVVQGSGGPFGAAVFERGAACCSPPA